MNRKIELIKFSQPYLNRGANEATGLEAAYSRLVLNRFEWEQLSDNERQARRRGRFH